jgi:hypothetical protein
MAGAPPPRSHPASDLHPERLPQSSHLEGSTPVFTSTAPVLPSSPPDPFAFLEDWNIPLAQEPSVLEYRRRVQDLNSNMSAFLTYVDELFED